MTGHGAAGDEEFIVSAVRGHLRLYTHPNERLSTQLITDEITARHFYKRLGKWCAWCDYLPVCLGEKRRIEETLVQIR